MTVSAIMGTETIRRRPLLVLELLDPITGALAGDNVHAAIEGFGKPALTATGQLVWATMEPPRGRTVKLTVGSRDGRYSGFSAPLVINPWVPGRGAHRERIRLEPTGRYVPPPGTLAAAGMLIEAPDTRRPLPQAQIRLFLDALPPGQPLLSDHIAVSDERGGFVVVARGLAEQPPLAAMPQPPNSHTAWLQITRAAAVRFSDRMPLRQARLTYLPDPLIWSALNQAPPP